MTRIIGISGYYHDSAAALIVDGKVIKAAQEERFSRIKNDPGFPQKALAYCVEGLNLSDIDYIVYYEKPFLKFERLLETYLAFAPRGFSQFRQSIPVWVKDKLFLKQILRRRLAQQFDLPVKLLPPLLFSQHHQAHAASAFFCSPYSDAAVLCIDGVGEWATTSAWRGKENKLDPLWQINFPHSLGLLYSAFTYYCGFKVNSGEYKLMGLAPFGEPKYKQLILENLIDVKPDGTFRLNLDFFGYCTGSTMISDLFRNLFGGRERIPESEITRRDVDLAASVQAVIELVVVRLAQTLQAETGCRSLCLAGGVALNCVANGKLRRETMFENVWVQPAAGDAGGALGAALSVWHLHLGHPRYVEFPDGMSQAQIGPEYGVEQITETFLEYELEATRLDYKMLFEKTSEHLANGKIVGWHQGRSEFGPRALGSRSILADARSPDMQRRLNLKIKARESFRPFAPIVLVEDASNYFEVSSPSPYMSFVEKIVPEIRLAETASDFSVDVVQQVNQKRSILPAVTHVDFTARLQTVDRQQNGLLYLLLSEFRKQTGCSVLVNTSFNVRGEPIVETPKDAISCFLNTEMDVLVIGNFMVEKSHDN